VRRPGLSAAAQCGPDAGQQFLATERLAHVVVGAQVEQLDRRAAVALARDDDDRHVRLARSRRQTSAPSRPGMARSSSTTSIGDSAEAAQRLLAVVRGNDPMTGLAEQCAERADHRRLVVDDQNGRAGGIRADLPAHAGSVSG
jgi:hypothetical protein